MHSEAWQQKKHAVWKRAGGVCEKCKQRRGAHVHHLIYAQRRGMEKLEWLQLVCLPCHGEYHPHHKFRTMAEQRAVAARRKAKRQRYANDPHKNCAHCGGTYAKGKHQMICVKYGLDKPAP